MSARDDFIGDNLGLVHACCRRYTGRGIEYDDLYQAGCIGLVQAADRFDKSRGLKFSTYAVPVILGEIRRLFREGGTVKVGRALKDLSLKAARLSTNFANEHGREPALSELAELLGVSPEQAAEAVTANVPPVSLTSDTDDGDAQIDVRIDNFDGELIDLLALRQVLHQLSEQDKLLIKLRYFGGNTQTQTAGCMGMTQVQVSRREKVILQELKRKMAG